MTSDLTLDPHGTPPTPPTPPGPPAPVELAVTSLDALVDELAAAAASASNGRCARTVHLGPDRSVRHTVVALAAGAELAEHDSPGEAVLQVLRGEVVLSAGPQSWTLGVGDLAPIPPLRHAVQATRDCAFLLSVVLRADRPQRPH